MFPGSLGMCREELDDTVVMNFESLGESGGG